MTSVSGSPDDEVPRTRDVGLLLAGNVVAALHQSPLLAPRPVLDQLDEWYLCRICFADLESPVPTPQSRQVQDVFRPAPHIDFHAAASEVTQQTACSQSPRHSWVPVAAPSEATDADVSATEDEGLAVIAQLLGVCEMLAGPPLAHAAGEYLLNGLHPTANASPPHLDISMLAALFTSMPAEQSGVSAVGSATTSYRVWACVAWDGASFPHQTALTSAVSTWEPRLRSMLRECGTVMGTKRDVHRVCPQLTPVHPPSCSSSSSSQGLALTGVKLQSSYALLRCVMEGLSGLGETGEGSSVRNLFADRATSENYVAKLLALQGPGLSRAVARGELAPQGTTATLFHITTGMLLYVQFHLSLRALGAARQCAQLAVLVGHQIHSDDLLALAHYSQFLVHMAAGCPTEAADSLSVAMHISTSASTTSGGESAAAVLAGSATTDASVVQTGSLCYLGAAQLLLYFPSSVGTSLRSAMTTSALWQSVERRSRGGDGDDDEVAPALYDPAVSATQTTGQGIAEDTQRALSLCEVEELYRPASGLSWIKLVSRISRETVRMMGAVYGLASSPQPFTEATIGELLVQVGEELRVSAPVTAVDPRRTLLREMIRHTAYRALVCHEGYLHLYPHITTSSSSSPVDVLQVFRRGVHAHYGQEGVQEVDRDEFFSGVMRYLVACRRAAQGYIASAYETLTALLVHLCRVSGLEQLSAPHFRDGGRAVEETSPLRSQARTETHSKPDDDIVRLLSSDDVQHTATTMYCAPDWLLLLSHVQWQRVELAAYLGYEATLDGMAAALEQLCLRCQFTFGVLTARLIRARALSTRLRYSDAREQLTHLESACAAIGLEGLLMKVRRERVSVALQIEAWADAMHALSLLEHGSCPPLSCTERWWCTRVRLSITCRVSEAQPVEEGSLLCAVLRRGLQELSQHPAVAAAKGEKNDGHATSFTELIQVLSTQLQVRLLLPARDTACGADAETEATLASLSSVVSLLQQRQFATGGTDEDCEPALHARSAAAEL